VLWSVLRVIAMVSSCSHCNDELLQSAPWWALTVSAITKSHYQFHDQNSLSVPWSVLIINAKILFNSQFMPYHFSVNDYYTFSAMISSLSAIIISARISPCRQCQDLLIKKMPRSALAVRDKFTPYNYCHDEPALCSVPWPAFNYRIMINFYSQCLDQLRSSVLLSAFAVNATVSSSGPRKYQPLKPVPRVLF
jgi:hypothetical protein